MTRTGQQLTVVVVQESGTGELVGLSGEMAITIVEKKHFYGFAFELPKAD